MFKVFHENQTSLSVSSVVHLVSNSKLISLHLIYDPTHALQNIRNNWVNEKNQTLSFVFPDTNTSIKAKWNDVKIIYKQEQIDPQNWVIASYSLQKVSLVLNVFNEKTVAALKQNNCNETAIF